MTHVSHARRKVTPPVKKPRKYGKRTFILVMGILLLITVIATTAGNIFSTGGSHKPASAQATHNVAMAPHFEQTRKATPAAVKPVHRVVKAVHSYTVKAGDCLSSIAQHFHMAGWHNLYHLNVKVVGANPNLIYAGQVLRL